MRRIGSRRANALVAVALTVTGYALPSASDRVVERNAPGLDQLGVVGISLGASGSNVSDPPQGTVRLLGTAHDEGLRAELLVSNYSNRLGDFDQHAVAALLRDDARIRRVARQVAAEVTDRGWDGVAVDLERLRRPDGPGLVRLVQELQARMPAERTVSVDISASDSLRGFRLRGYRLSELAGAADVLVLMAYDLHGPTWSGPGPIGALPWQRRVLRTVAKKVPDEQVDLGVAGYGYSWPQHGTGRSLTVRRARNLVAADHAKAVWKPKPGEWTARLSNGTVLWWSDGRSYEKRRELAATAALHGLALWRLGSADPVG
ncbi:MAG: Spore germination protein YaaH [Nocardioides sp.]|nr:Spore germination protein YaaH [Nocardioides sp.]